MKKSQSFLDFQLKKSRLAMEEIRTSMDYNKYRQLNHGFEVESPSVSKMDKSAAETLGMKKIDDSGVTPDLLDTVKGSRLSCTRSDFAFQEQSAGQHDYNLQTIPVEV